MIKLKLLLENNQRLLDADKRYPLAGNVVDGREVGSKVDNMGSIGASFENYEILKGIREVPMSDFSDPKKMYVAMDDIRRSQRLAETIRDSNMITPLIIAIDDQGPYILEGGHRFSALGYLEAKSFPALVVIDMDS